MANFLNTTGHELVLTAQEWYDDYEDLIDWDFFEELSPTTRLYVGGIYDIEGVDTAVALHRMTFTSTEMEDVIVENLGVHTSPEAAMKAAGIGHFHKVASNIYEYWHIEDEEDWCFRTASPI